MTATAMPAEPEILCIDLVRIFVAQGVEVQALQGLNLRVERGEIVAVVGASGSGKSTLLTILSGLDRPTAGAAQVAGRNLLAMSDRDRVEFRRNDVGFVWQQTERNLLPYLTAAQNVVMAMVAGGTARRSRESRVTALLDLLGVGDVRDRRPGEMSGGQRQRVAIAVALANEPRVLLADEPTGELDESSSADVLEAIRSVNAELGVTALIVTHDAGVSDHVRRTVQLRDGRTSTEVLRRTELDDDGSERHIAEEFAVLDAAGRLQLPADYLTALGLRERVRLALETDRVEVFPDRPTAATAAAERSADAGAAREAGR